MSTAHRGLDVQHAPDARGRFGRFGGRFVPETVMAALDELEAALARPASTRPSRRAGRPCSAITSAGRRRSTSPSGSPRDVGGAQIWLKREDLAHTGAHKINNALGQALLAGGWASRASWPRPARASTAWRAPPCAPASASSASSTWARRTRGARPNVFRMHLLGATVVPVTSGTATLKEAMNEAIRDWIANVETTHYLIGSAAGPHPYPMLVRELQSVIGREARARCWPEPAGCRTSWWPAWAAAPTPSARFTPSATTPCG